MASFSHRFLIDYSINTPVNQLLLIFKSKCSEILEKLVASKWSSERYSQPWITSKGKRITRKQKTAHGKSMFTRDWKRYRALTALVDCRAFGLQRLQWTAASLAQ